jgi:hypothetical protein
VKIKIWKKYTAAVILSSMFLFNAIVTQYKIKAQFNTNNLTNTVTVNDNSVTINVINNIVIEDAVTITLYSRINSNMKFMDQIRLNNGQGTFSTVLEPGTYYGFVRSASDSSSIQINEFAVILLPELDKTALLSAIIEAQKLYAGAIEGTAAGNYAIGSKATLYSAIEAAQAVSYNVTTQASIDEAVITLNNSVTLFKNGRVINSGGGDSEPDPVTTPAPTPSTGVILNSDSAAVANAIKASSNNSNISVDANVNKKVDQVVFDAIKGTNKNVTFITDVVQWTFNGKDITGDTKSIDLTVKVADINSSTSINKPAIAEMIKNTEVAVITFSDNGRLPGKATVKIKLDNNWLKDKNKNKIYVYYYNEASKSQELIAKQLKADDKGYIQFDITHNSDYLVSDRDIAEIVARQKLNRVFSLPVFSNYNRAYAEMLKVDTSTSEGKITQEDLMNQLAPYWEKVATPYVLNGLKELDGLAKDKNLLDYNRMLVEFQDQSKMSKEDKTYNMDYLLGELAAWGDSGCLFSKAETTAIDQVNRTWNNMTKENIDLSKQLINNIQNSKSKQWLEGELEKIRNIQESNNEY